MNLRHLSIAAGILGLIVLAGLRSDAQSVQRIGESLNTGNSSLVINLLRDRQGQRRPAAGADSAVVRFKPIGDSGVAKALADALGGDPQQKAALTEAFLQIKQGYEAEVAKEGKSNNLAAAFTFFISANVMAYTQSEPPSDRATEMLFADLQSVIAGVPEFARMSDLEKQKMHDWLVCIGGFAMSGYLDARQNGDKNSLGTYREFADYAIRLVLGIEAGKLNFKGDEFSVEGDKAVAQPAGAGDKKIVGVWSKSSSSPWGTAPGDVATNAGYYKGQYQFKADGTYSFKGESWGGYSRSEEFWTIAENGVYSISGDVLTISPSASVATQRNAAGVVRRSQNNALEKVAYKWRLHYFEGIGETNLVLQPQRPTQRDGGFAGNSAFPNSYLYSQGSSLEWRFQ
ncbi:MAG TPA: lipocalin family protein [Blastocatellia bacterium]|nr:lipocalin family protein [Blastocatellia bacterium]